MSKDEDTHDIRILKKATCPTVSGKSRLKYEVCALPDSSIHLRITHNTGGGFHSDELVPVKDILDVFGEVPEGQAITSWVLQPLFRGKSVNTPAFLVAALSNEKLLRLMKGKKRGHIVVEPEAFMARMEKLTSSNAAVKTKATPRKTAKASPKKALIKKRASVKRKKATTRRNASSS